MNCFEKFPLLSNLFDYMIKNLSSGESRRLISMGFSLVKPAYYFDWFLLLFAFDLKYDHRILRQMRSFLFLYAKNIQSFSAFPQLLFFLLPGGSRRDYQ